MKPASAAKNRRCSRLLRFLLCPSLDSLNIAHSQRVSMGFWLSRLNKHYSFVIGSTRAIGRLAVRYRERGSRFASGDTLRPNALAVPVVR